MGRTGQNKGMANEGSVDVNGSVSNEERPGDMVYRLLHRAIIEQALKPGTRLPEDTTGDQFGVSRTVVRQALGRLASDGLVEISPNRGALVATPSLDEARETFNIRAVLEREVILRLAGKCTDEILQKLEAHVDREEAARSKGGAESIRLAGEFHLKLAECAGNRLLARYVREVVARCSLILAAYARPHSADCAVVEHRQIIEMLRSGEIDQTITLMDHHLDAVASRAQLSEDEPMDLKAVLTHYIEKDPV